MEIVLNDAYVSIDGTDLSAYGVSVAISMSADEIVFEKGKPPLSAGEEQVEGGSEATDAELRSIWLRQVQTKPADFLRAKFAQQYATRKSGGQ